MSSFRAIPSVDALLADRRIRDLIDEHSRSAVLDLVRSQLDHARAEVGQGNPATNVDEVVAAVKKQAGSRWRTWPTPVINATGVVLHTNLGRAPLSHEATAAAVRAGESYGDLELDLRTGKRGSRYAHVSALICQLTGAEAAIVVNNNASAVLLALAAITAGKEVIVSRSEAVEIGGGFRVPDVLRQSGATLVDVGTTNRTYAADYETAITDSTGAILAVHASNFRVEGFVHTPEIKELAELGKARKIPVLHDLGSGCLIDTTQYGLAHEPMPQESIAAGVSLAFFSGDKLLGGPQAGIIAGDADLVNQAAAHPLARAVRSDKLTLGALTATLLHYIRDEAEQKIPIWQMVSATEADLASRAETWKAAIDRSPTPPSEPTINDPVSTADDGPVPPGAVSTTPGRSTVGGGSLPGETLPTTLLAIDCTKIDGGAEAIATRLRQAGPPIIARIEDERVLLDPRTVLPTQDHSITTTLRNTLA